MPLTKTGKEVMANMKKKYGKRAKEVFYRSINKGVAGSSKWHKTSNKSYSKGAVDHAMKKVI